MLVYLLHVNAVTCTAENETGFHCPGETLGLYSVRESVLPVKTSTYLIRDLLLLLPWKVDKVVVLCSYQERDSSLVEASSLPVPFLNGVECALAGQVEHEEYGNSVVAD